MHGNLRDGILYGLQSQYSNYNQEPDVIVVEDQDDRESRDYDNEDCSCYEKSVARACFMKHWHGITSADQLSSTDQTPTRWFLKSK